MSGSVRAMLLYMKLHVPKSSIELYTAKSRSIGLKWNLGAQITEQPQVTLFSGCKTP